MTTPEILGIVGFVTLLVERIASHVKRKDQAEGWVRRWFDVFAADLRQEHARCQKELAEIREILSFIKHDSSPAE